MPVTSDTSIKCFHCGDYCPNDSININDKYFCCEGCKLVYEILNENNLCNYYSIEQNPGIKSQAVFSKNKFEYLDDEALQKKLFDFEDNDIVRITFYIPQMHCSSCIWLLENLYKLDKSIVHSKVDFLNKKLFLGYLRNQTSLRKIVELLASIGYEPQINLDSLEKKESQVKNKQLYYKVGIAGFAFGNIMMFSFPEYFSLDTYSKDLQQTFNFLKIVLSLPVFFYCGSDYFISAYKGLRKKIINIDVPLALGILVLFIHSFYEILSGRGPGYLDSLAGLVFFLLIGKIFQNKTYETLNFERNYKSYFPISVETISKGEKKVIPLSELKRGDKIIIRNDEIIPADAMLYKGNAFIDYSFVTGESTPRKKNKGEIIYAGGKQVGGIIELEVIKDVSQSYLTQLWNNEIFSKSEKSNLNSIINFASKYFTIGILLIAFISFAVWFTKDVSTAVFVFTSVLIIACPCALALSLPFTFGNTMRIFGKNKFYLKNVSVVENLHKVNLIVFDKTGTITNRTETEIEYSGIPLKEHEKLLIKSLANNSTHPLSKKIFEKIIVEKEILFPDIYIESLGEGIEGKFNDKRVRIGTKDFVFNDSMLKEEFLLVSNLNINKTNVFISIDGIVKGLFIFHNSYRENLEEVITALNEKYETHLVTGDNEGEKENLLKYFRKKDYLHFNFSPYDKLNFIKQKQSEEKNVLMIGDGLNDAGALKQSNVGITISENASYFSPACDAILESSSFKNINKFIKLSHTSIIIIRMSFLLSFLYNILGLSFAVQAQLSPVIAAILMPLSSISVVVFTTLTTNFFAKKYNL